MVTALSLFSGLAAYLPILGIVWVVRWLDRYDREPWSLIFLCFLWGSMGATTIAGTLNYLAHVALPGGFEGFVVPVLVAPLTEEPAKAAILLLLCRLRPFDNVTDGFVYGAVTGLGFAAGENAGYFGAAAQMGDASQWGSLVFVRTFWTASLHACATSIVGAALGSLRYNPKISTLRAWRALLLAMCLHGAWNLQAVTSSPLLQAMGFFGIPLLLTVLFVILQVCLWREHKQIRAQLQAEAQKGTLPKEHVPWLSSWIRRDWGKWVPEGVDRKEYIHLATRLAFRRQQLTTDPKSDFLKREVKRLRVDLRVLLGK